MKEQYHMHVYKSADGKTQSVRIGQDETSFAIGVDFVGVAGDLPPDVVAGVARDLANVLDRHLYAKAHGVSNIIKVPTTGRITMPLSGLPVITKGNGYGLHR